MFEISKIVRGTKIWMILEVFFSKEDNTFWKKITCEWKLFYRFCALCKVCFLFITTVSIPFYLFSVHSSLKSKLTGCSLSKVIYIPSTLNIGLILCHTQLIVGAENVKSWFKSWVFPFTFKLIPCPIHWFVYVLANINFIFEF